MKDFLKNIKWKWVFLFLIVLIFSLCVPFAINEMYQSSGLYPTLWDAKDTLSFYGSYLSFLGTTILGIVAYAQTKKAHSISDRLLEIESERFRLDTEPLIYINGWKAYQQNQVYLDFNLAKLREIMVDTVTTDNPLCIEFELLNPTNNFVYVFYDYATDEKGVRWANSTSSQETQWIDIPPNAKNKIVFYADKAFFEGVIGQNIMFSFILRNQLLKSYRENIQVEVLTLFSLGAADALPNWHISCMVKIPEKIFPISE